MFIVTNDCNDDFIEVSPVMAHTLEQAFKKELTYWRSKTAKYRNGIGSKPTTEQIATLTRMEQRVCFYSANITRLHDGIVRCSANQ